MTPFERAVLRALVDQYSRLPESEKLGVGVRDRVLAEALAFDLNIEPFFVDHPDFHASDPRLRMLNALKMLEDMGLVAKKVTTGIGWFSPTVKGREMVDEWLQEERSPVFQGKRIVRYVYELQQDLLAVHRRVGRGGQVDLGGLCSTLSIDEQMYLRGAQWAMRQGYLDEPSIDQYSVDNGGIYITDEGMNAVDSDFKTELPASGPTINIHDSQVYGNILAAGRDAMTITSPEISASAVEIRQLLGEIQEAIDTLGEDDDVRHDALQEIESLQREFSKESPTPGRIERSLSAIGSVASIGALAGPQLARLLELAQQLPGM